MIQRGIGIFIGAIVSLILLGIMVPDSAGWQDYIAPLAIGGVAAFFWPVVIAFWLGRRAKQRREDQVSSEVQRQLDQQKNNPGG
jgi:membrane protein DedA with SNARE-associated domain